MKKENLTDLINRFYLSGQLTKESGDWYPVEITVENSIAKVSIKTTDGTTLISTDQNVDGMEDGSFTVGNIKQLLSMLSVFEPEVDIQFQKKGQKYNNVMVINDKKMEAKIALADPQIVTSTSQLNKLPEFDLTFALNKEFIEKIAKAKKAISDAKFIAVIPDSLTKSVDFVLNYSLENTNNIRITQTDVELVNEFDPLFFDATNLATIMNINTDFRVASISISSAGLMVIQFNGEDWESKYYLKAYQM